MKIKKKLVCLGLAVTLLVGTSLTASAGSQTTNVTGGHFTIGCYSDKGTGSMSVSNNNSKTLSITVYSKDKSGNYNPVSASDSGTKQSLSCSRSKPSTDHTMVYTYYSVFTGIQGYTGSVYL